MKLAIYGYGNIGRGIEAAVLQNPDAELYGIFTRRDPAAVQTRTGAKVFPAGEILAHKGKFDVLLLCGGSATDLPVMTPALARDFNVVDSFDTHAKIPEHFAAVDAAAKESGHVGFISGGWDPGLFSLARLYAQAALPLGESYTFWGRGVSQGHSDAIRRVPGVKDARQYTVPIEEAVQRVRSGENPCLTTREKHLRECWVVAEEGADRDAIAKTIREMPNYFADYDTTVNFISEEELKEKHSGLPHGGTVIRSGKSGFEEEHTNTVEFRLQLDSNPEFTSGVLLACARAVFRMAARGECGAKTIFDLAPKDLSIYSEEELRAKLL